MVAPSFAGIRLELGHGHGVSCTKQRVFSGFFQTGHRVCLVKTAERLVKGAEDLWVDGFLG